MRWTWNVSTKQRPQGGDRRGLGGIVGALALVVGLTGCGGCNWLTGGDGRRPKQGIIVKCKQSRAALFVNEELVGLVSAPKGMVVGLRPGTYRVMVKRDGYFTRYINVVVKKREFSRLDVKLIPELD